MLPRRVVLAGAIAGASGCLSRGSRTLGPSHRPGSSVLVVGGGLAGLAVAHLLVKRGVDVTVLEATERPGGRVLTLRAPWHDGLFVEAGATHVVPQPDLLALCAEFDVALERRPTTGGLAKVSVFGGSRRVTRPGEPGSSRWRLGSSDEALGESGRMKKYFAAAESFDPELPVPASLEALDSMSGAEYLRRQGASPGFIAEIDVMLGEGDAGLEGMSALALVHSWAEIRREIPLGPSLRVVGGSDRLPHAMASRLGDRIVHGAAVTALEQDESGVRVTFRRGGEFATVAAGRAVLAMPPTVLRDLVVRPAWSVEKSQALANVRLESVTRVWIETRQRFWKRRGESGRVEMDGPLGSVRDESDGLPGESGLLGLYVCRRRARELAALGELERTEAALSYFETAHPGARECLIAVTSKCWDTDPFQRGAYAYRGPGQERTAATVLARAEGRFHFAGDHTSHRPGFMHGALASARRVAAELMP